MYVPNIPKVKLLIQDEIHKIPYSGHPGYQKTITMLRKEYFWPNMKTEVAEYIARCFECQQVKIEHQHPAIYSATSVFIFGQKYSFLNMVIVFS